MIEKSTVPPLRSCLTVSPICTTPANANGAFPSKMEGCYLSNDFQKLPRHHTNVAVLGCLIPSVVSGPRNKNLKDPMLEKSNEGKLRAVTNKLFCSRLYLPEHDDWTVDLNHEDEEIPLLEDFEGCDQSWTFEDSYVVT